jgi:uncharacterized membrane protein (DUF106 family)
MYMMVFLTLFVLLNGDLRDSFTLGARAVFHPLIGFNAAYPVITLLLAGSLTTTISSVLRHVFVDWINAARVGKQMGALRKAQMEAMRRGNPAKVEKLREMQGKLALEMNKVQIANMKPLAFTFLFFIIFISWLSAFVYVDAYVAGRSVFAVPWQPQVDLRASYGFPAWILLYSLLAIPVSQVLTRLLKFLQFRKRLAALGAQAE